MTQFILISLDPGFEHLAYVIALVTVNTTNITATFTFLKAGVVRVARQQDDIATMSAKVFQTLKPIILPYLQMNNQGGNSRYSQPPYLIALVEQGVNSVNFAGHSLNWQIQLRFLEITLFCILQYAFGSSATTKAVMIPATFVKQYFHTSTSSYLGNKEAGFKLSKQLIVTFFPRIEDQQKLAKLLYPHNNFQQDQHTTDAFNQMMFFLNGNLLPSMIRNDINHASTGFVTSAWKFYIQSYYLS